ncbi:hypothetical protein DFH27DRAFT_598514 [Peziza echinospora]|nr:hypothetical protein DFH27DRAFT_598514 [Peziza echinospora]
MHCAVCCESMIKHPSPINLLKNSDGLGRLWITNCGHVICTKHMFPNGENADQNHTCPHCQNIGISVCNLTGLEDLPPYLHAFFQPTSQVLENFSGALKFQIDSLERLVKYYMHLTSQLGMELRNKEEAISTRVQNIMKQSKALQSENGYLKGELEKMKARLNGLPSSNADSFPSQSSSLKRKNAHDGGAIESDEEVNGTPWLEAKETRGRTIGTDQYRGTDFGARQEEAQKAQSHQPRPNQNMKFTSKDTVSAPNDCFLRPNLPRRIQNSTNWGQNRPDTTTGSSGGGNFAGPASHATPATNHFTGHYDQRSNETSPFFARQEEFLKREDYLPVTANYRPITSTKIPSQNPGRMEYPYTPHLSSSPIPLEPFSLSTSSTPRHLKTSYLPRREEIKTPTIHGGSYPYNNGHERLSLAPRSDPLVPPSRHQPVTTSHFHREAYTQGRPQHGGFNANQTAQMEFRGFL